MTKEINKIELISLRAHLPQNNDKRQLKIIENEEDQLVTYVTAFQLIAYIDELRNFGNKDKKSLHRKPRLGSKERGTFL